MQDKILTEEQNLYRQIDILEQVGCDRIYEEKVSGIKKERPELNKMLDQIRTGDVIIIPDLTRLSRSVKDLFSLIEQIEEKVLILNQLRNLGLILQLLKEN